MPPDGRLRILTDRGIQSPCPWIMADGTGNVDPDWDGATAEGDMRMLASNQGVLARCHHPNVGMRSFGAFVVSRGSTLLRWLRFRCT